MKSLRSKLKTECGRMKVASHVIEKDYALSYVLAGIAAEPTIKNTLIFKGGTALKKIFFGDYRFSEDLDFSVDNAPKQSSLEKALINAANYAKDLLNQYGPFETTLKRNPERAPHPKGQEAFNIYVKFPWHVTANCRIKIEVTHDEPLILSPQYKPIIHGYNEPLTCQIACYQIEEIIAEKLRALLQTHHKLMTRGWNRPRARDYYDLWNILKNYLQTVNRSSLKEILDKKCQHRSVTYNDVDDFFTTELIKEASLHWRSTLGILVQDLPACDQVLEETKFLIGNLL